MSELIYKVRGDFAECQALKEGDAKCVKVTVIGRDSGILSIGERSIRLRDGVSYLSLEGLDDGDYTPTLITEDGIVKFEAIRKTGVKITHAPIDREKLSRLYDYIDRLENRIADAEAKLGVLEREIVGTPLFET